MGCSCVFAGDVLEAGAGRDSPLSTVACFPLGMKKAPRGRLAVLISRSVVSSLVGVEPPLPYRTFRSLGAPYSTNSIPIPPFNFKPVHT